VVAFVGKITRVFRTVTKNVAEAVSPSEPVTVIVYAPLAFPDIWKTVPLSKVPLFCMMQADVEKRPLGFDVNVHDDESPLLNLPVAGVPGVGWSLT
jgi:hypothetical protein